MSDIFDRLKVEQKTSEWLELRQHGLGGSDMSSIMGLNHYATPLDVWLEKTGRKTHEDISGKWAVAKGNVLETPLRRRFRTLHPELSVQEAHAILRSKAHPVLQASVDGILHRKGETGISSYGILEIKTANSRREHEWKTEDGEYMIPDYYLAQVTHYMAVTGYTWGYVYADLGGSEPVEIKFTRDEDDITSVITAAEDFWGYVQRDEMPQLTGEDVVKVYPQDDASLQPTEDTRFENLARTYKEYTKTERLAKAEKDRVGNELKTLIGEHKGLISTQYKATYTTTTYKERFTPARTNRVLRVNEIKTKETK